MKEHGRIIGEKLVRRHLVYGWWSLAIFLLLGVILESMHGFKIGWYLNAGNETRRFLWTLAHAHGALLSLVNIAYAFTLSRLSMVSCGHNKFISLLLLMASVLFPAGFFLGGTVIYQGDPGIGIIFAVVGAILLLISVFAIAYLIRKSCNSVDAGKY